jgi:hypothetical protein
MEQKKSMDPTLRAQIAPYLPSLIIAGVFVLFILLRLARKGLRRRIDEFGYRLLGEKGVLIWFWMNAPGVMLHELSHALVVLLFTPFHFRITSITFFRIKPIEQRGRNRHAIVGNGRLMLQLGEVQYNRPSGKFMTYIGDGMSGIAPLFGGIVMLAFLYWVATGYSLWDFHQQILRPGWPWWTLLFAPYLILTVTSELWPSSQDWHNARWFVLGVALVTMLTLVLLWYSGVLVFNSSTLQAITSIATHIDYALLLLLALELVFILIAEVLVRTVR